ncbi:cytoplasmic protein [Peribacillus muralis]|uniref:cytoplasmic protein n=1 Tax=Peribacillus muralis TaxID=264697 RepID=UPI0038010741
MKQTILLRRKRMVWMEKGTDMLPVKYMATALKNLESLGFTFSKPLIDVLTTLSIEEFVSFFQQTILDVKNIIGAHAVFRPMYPNFPSQVMEADEAELYWNAIIHYLDSFVHDVTGLKTDGSLPAYTKDERFPLLDRVDLEVINLAPASSFDTMIHQIIASNSSLSVADQEDVEWVIKTYSPEQIASSILPECIPMKETIAFVAGALLNHQKADIEQLSRFFNTSTDVLRLAVFFSGGDVSLAAVTKFRKFKRRERRFILGLLEACPSLTEDMLRYKKEWIRLGEILHPGEYAHNYPHAKKAFDVLRNSLDFETFSSKLEKAIERKDINLCVALLRSRPGEFARRLDHLIRLSHCPEEVISAFSDVADSVTTPVLLQLATHFKHRHLFQPTRTFFPKGNVGKVQLVENALVPLDRELSLSASRLCEEALQRRFSKLPPLGHAYIDERLKEQLVPFAQRSASKSLRSLVRGSKLNLPEGDTIRFFTWWKEGPLLNGGNSDRIDIDLSAVIYSEEWEVLDHISFTNLKSTKFHSVHSGDITSAPHGACEFIDMHISSIEENGGRYVTMSLQSYTDQSFVSMPECFAGWMSREEPNSGEVFEPSTVQDKVDLTANTIISIPVILDLFERKVIWADVALKAFPHVSNTVENNKDGLIAIGKALSSLIKPNLYDLFTLHAQSRGEMADDPKKADVIFSLHDGLTPFDQEKILAEFLI